LSAFSTDLITDVGYEINDVSPDAKDILYAFIESSPVLTKETLTHTLKDFGVKKEAVTDILTLLVWYGFLGLLVNSSQAKYIYDFNYNMQLP
jgi:hypothetical protein